MVAAHPPSAQSLSSGPQPFLAYITCLYLIYFIPSSLSLLSHTPLLPLTPSISPLVMNISSNPAEGARQGPEPGPSPANPGQAGPLLPKKGILKKARQRESGYYSSPEPSESGELLDAGDVFVSGDTDAGNVFVSGDTVEHKPPPASGRLPHRKGILKHNGKFSHAALEHTAPTTFGSLDELASPHPPARASRPSGAVSEDSILSSESFDQLDLPERLPEPPLRGSVSVDNLLGLEAPPSEGPGSRGLRRWRQDLLGIFATL